jgi:ABC-type dipeptide/oligopeptide/nickel transport system ATPase component
MKDGRIVEEGPSERIFTAPEAPYTKELMLAALAGTRFGKEPGAIRTETPVAPVDQLS